jgi:hypothetical protein
LGDGVGMSSSKVSMVLGGSSAGAGYSPLLVWG